MDADALQRVIAENIARTNAELAKAEADAKVDPHKFEKAMFIDMLAGARLDKSLTQAELAKQLEMHQSAIARIESGKSNPSLSTLLAIAKALNVHLVLE